MNMAEDEFSGSKIALFEGEHLLTYQRDDFDHIPFPGLWDLPGGGREDNETAEECVLRELYEEFDLTLDRERIVWKRRYESSDTDGAATYFFVAHITADEVNSIRFGSEGQRWRMEKLSSFMSQELAIPHLVSRISDYLSAS